MREGTKPTTSRAQSHIIKRPRLTKLLDDSGAKLILLVAPAGYGKTTLAREWTGAYRRPLAWYQASTASADVAALATGLAVELDGAVGDGEPLRRSTDWRHSRRSSSGLTSSRGRWPAAATGHAD